MQVNISGNISKWWISKCCRCNCMTVRILKYHAQGVRMQNFLEIFPQNNLTRSSTLHLFSYVKRARSQAMQLYTTHSFPDRLTSVISLLICREWDFWLNCLFCVFSLATCFFDTGLCIFLTFFELPVCPFSHT
jgi:hypothetical protein